MPTLNVSTKTGSPVSSNPKKEKCSSPNSPVVASLVVVSLVVVSQAVDSPVVVFRADFKYNREYDQ